MFVGGINARQRSPRKKDRRSVGLPVMAPLVRKRLEIEHLDELIGGHDCLMRMGKLPGLPLVAASLESRKRLGRYRKGTILGRLRMKTQLQSSLAIWALSVSLAGCHYATHVAHTSASPLASAPASIPSAEIVPTSFFQPVSASSIALEQNVLELESLIQEVLHRNPSLAQMEAAWQAASTRFPQVTALEDPMIAGWMAPGSIGSNMVDFAGRLEVSQKIPYPGKRNLRGEAALAEAQATGRDVDDIRLQLIETTRMAFYDYYAVDRSLAVNEEALRLLGEFRDNAETRFKTAQGQQQDLLQADVEIGRQRERRLQLERTREVTLARINT